MEDVHADYISVSTLHSSVCFEVLLSAHQEIS